MHRVAEKCGQTLGTSYKYQNKKKVNVNVFPETFQLLVIAESSQFNINVWTWIVGDCIVGPHVLPHRLTGNHYRDFLLHDLSKLLEVTGSQSTNVFRHILTVLCAMFSIAAIMTDGKVKEDPVHGSHARQISILWIFTYGDT
jgi:hypothetical protein